ncbi:MAG: MerR family DNA-binding protein [Xanthomonadaceae bacterium]|jgi:MerR family copper efflux transcriptional regulator|nr:MerR family DNA-binding protein [Xanthomonadaceae bacterium]
MNTTVPASFTIGALARETGVVIDTTGFHGREELPTPVRRRDSGYRGHDRGAVERLGFIRRAKESGFGLEEIRELAMLENNREHGVEGVRQHALQRLAGMDRRLARRVEACPGRGEPGACPILLDIRSRGEESAVPVGESLRPVAASVEKRTKAS